MNVVFFSFRVLSAIQVQEGEVKFYPFRLRKILPFQFSLNFTLSVFRLKSFSSNTTVENQRVCLLEIWTSCFNGCGNVSDFKHLDPMFQVLFCQCYLFGFWTLVFGFIIFYCVGEKKLGFTISVNLWGFGFTIIVHSTCLYEIWNVFQVVMLTSCGFKC